MAPAGKIVRLRDRGGEGRGGGRAVADGGGAGGDRGRARRGGGLSAARGGGLAPAERGRGQRGRRGRRGRL